MTGEPRCARRAGQKPRARDLGLPFPGRPGPSNAVTDVAGVEVGYATIVADAPSGAVRTGVTVVMPRGRAGQATLPVWAGFHALNGNGEMTGTHWVREAGWFLGPVAVTNTHAVGMVHHALSRWMVEQARRQPGPYAWMMPVVAETCDAYLNDMNGFHVTEAHVLAAITDARGGPIEEGNVGGGTGMICYEFKGGTGTASRVVATGGRSYTIGALVQANFGLRPWLRVLGAPVGEHLTGPPIWSRQEQGSVIVVVATDAPLLPNQLERLARRAALGVGRTGTPSGDGSGDLCLAFSTANEGTSPRDAEVQTMLFLPHHGLDPFFEATAQAVEEAIVNALVAAETMVGYEGRRVEAIDHTALVELMQLHRPPDGVGRKPGAISR